MHSYQDFNEMTRRGRHDFDLMEFEPHELIDVGSLIHSSDIEDLRYPENGDLARVGIRGIYLSNYIPWDSRIFSERMIEKFGASASKNARTFDTYDRIDDMTYMTIHDVLKQGRLGYSRVTDNLCREIRFKRIIKEDARIIENFFQAQKPNQEINHFLNWLGMKPEGFRWYLERLPFSAQLESDKVFNLNETQTNFVNSFVVNHKDVSESKEYTIFGKGLSI